MSNYVWEKGTSYWEYLGALYAVDTPEEASLQGARVVSLEVSNATREIIASDETLAREQIEIAAAAATEITASIEDAAFEVVEAIEEGVEQLGDRLERLNYSVKVVGKNVSELGATFEWGFAQIMFELGHMKDSFEELIRVAKTPIQTMAFNHFEIARDAFRQGLYAECLEELEKAIHGDHSSPGYKLEWRFYQMLGTLRLGFVKGDPSLMDLALAEEGFLSAARYAKTDYAEDAARALLSASWAAYCQGEFVRAMEYTNESISLHPKLAEAHFLAAKVSMALGKPKDGFAALTQAIRRDPHYTIKAAGDGDFQRFESELRKYLMRMRKREYARISDKVRNALEIIAPWRRRHPTNFLDNKALHHLEKFQTDGVDWCLLDILLFDLDVNFLEDDLKPGGSLTHLLHDYKTLNTRKIEFM